MIFAIFVSLFASTISYELTVGFVREGYIASDLNIELPKDQDNNTAIENLNFGEILLYPEDQTNISNSLYLFTERYTIVKILNISPMR